LIEIEYKRLKKQLKLMKGLSKAPDGQRQRMEGLLDELKKKTGLDTIEAVEKRLGEVKEARESILAKSKTIPDDTKLRAWYLRPLLSHLDHPKKIDSLADGTIGVGGLSSPLVLHIPAEWGLTPESYEPLRRFFSFKGYGKGTIESAELEQQFLQSVSLSHEMPFQLKGLTDLPLLHYNIDGLQSLVLEENRPVSIVSGVCPVSLISNEFELVYESGRAERPALGFESLRAPDEKITELRFPPRPIAGDYIELVRVFSMANRLSEHLGSDNVNVTLWLPMHDYQVTMTSEIFSNWFALGVLTHDQVYSGLNLLSERYISLIKAVSNEFDFKGKLIIENPDEDTLALHIDELVHLLSSSHPKIIEDRIPLIYGLYAGTTLRRHLFEQLAFKHMQKLIEDPETSVLHIENSYELWPSLFAARLADAWAAKALPGCTKYEQVYSFICAPSIPSPSLKYMRSLNSPHEEKIYLGVPTSEFEGQLAKMRPKYTELLNCALPGTELKSRLTELNSIFSD
jgi:hypothetical protein